MTDDVVYYKCCPECELEKERAAWPSRDCITTAERHREYMEVKRAAQTAALFPAPLRSWNRHCPRHQHGLASDVAHIVSTRFIPVDWFDVFTSKGEHLCRACGARMLTKKGKPCARLRWCQSPDDGHYKLVLETLFDFASRREWYIHDLQCRQIPDMQARHADKIATKELVLHKTGAPPRYFYWWDGAEAILCEGCGKLVAKGKSFSSKPGSDVHHKKPVCHATIETIMSIFDPTNFVVLCNECHGKSHPWRKRPAPPPERVTTLESFLNTGAILKGVDDDAIDPR